jgi:hypothetical protein
MTNVRKRLRHLSLTLFLCLLGAACADGEKKEEAYAAPPVFGAVDNSKVCDPGYVGWDFGTGGGVEGLPKPMTIKSLDCDGAGEPAKPAQFGQGARKQCTDATSCSFVERCETIAVEWTCAGSDVVFKREFPGGRGSLSCYLPGNSKSGADDVDADAGKACIPKTCPNNTFRDERMRCVTAIKRRPGWFALGFPDARPLQRTSANPSAQRLVGNTEYLFSVQVSIGDNGYESE